MQNNQLTARQQEILDFITRNIGSHGFPPTIPEMQKEFSFKSPTTVSDHLTALVKKGFITRRPNISRGISLNNSANGKKSSENNSYEIPIIGKVAAGLPILASESLEGKLIIDKSLISNPENIFALRIKGNSMIDANIKDGDFVIIHQQPQVEQGEIAAVLINDEATVKKYYRDGDKIRLQPENETMPPIIIDPKEKEVSIIGKVKGVIRKV